MNPIGWREYESAPLAAAATLGALRELAVSLLSDNMARASGMLGLRPYHRPKPLAGTAVTVHTRPGDNLAIHRAFDFCRPGDVLVIDGAGDLTQALMGEIMASFAQSLGVEGLVIDGAIRDVGALGQRDFPVYARGVTHRGPYKNGPGEINVPVTVGGMVVHPGDIIVGDEDGLLAIAPADAEAVIEGARRQQAKEMAALKSIAEGNFDRSWVAPQRDRMMNT
ncbi:RraA family protein [Paraburkholderia strydomiana]|uniref:RraA family protein n=1 Tax=Paraburkholderia strydomiana TaxID=1245417 RepID=UPI0038BB8B30